MLYAEEATISGGITATSLTLGSNVSIAQSYITGLSDDLTTLTNGNSFLPTILIFLYTHS